MPIHHKGPWAWDANSDNLKDSIIREKLRPFVRIKVVE